jgi:hypothetical protein
MAAVGSAMLIVGSAMAAVGSAMLIVGSATLAVGSAMLAVGSGMLAAGVAAGGVWLGSMISGIVDCVIESLTEVGLSFGTRDWLAVKPAETLKTAEGENR